MRNLKHAQLEVSVIKLMSFNTLAISIKLRVRSKDAFNKKKTTFISLFFKKSIFKNFALSSTSRRERKKFTLESSKCRIKRKLHMRIYSPYHVWSAPQGEFLLLSKSKQPLFLLLHTKHTPGPCFLHYPKNFLHIV